MAPAMIELPTVLAVAAALVTGVVLGAVFFGGLWWTVQRGMHSRHAALWFSLSLVLRTGVALLGFMLVAHGSWSRLAICLAGFAVARVIVTRLTSLAPAASASAPVPVPVPVPVPAEAAAAPATASALAGSRHAP